MTNDGCSPTPEKHPLEPFLPENARVLMLGSFPPKQERWSMPFYYPNFINDMWRIVGLVFHGDRSRFIAEDGKHFDKDRITAFCSRTGIALYDTATEVIRLKDNASDKFLEVVTPTDIRGLLSRLPHCRAIITTGQKAAETIVKEFGCELPATGTCVPFHMDGREFRLWRLPSSSRAYPLALDKKAEAYRKMFLEEGFDLTGGQVQP